jgi:hypothetical protein
VNPHDPEAGITKMKNGRTHLPYKAGHAVDFESGPFTFQASHFLDFAGTCEKSGMLMAAVS